MRTDPTPERLKPQWLRGKQASERPKKLPLGTKGGETYIVDCRGSYRSHAPPLSPTHSNMMCLSLWSRLGTLPATIMQADRRGLEDDVPLAEAPLSISMIIGKRESWNM